MSKINIERERQKDNIQLFARRCPLYTTEPEGGDDKLEKLVETMIQRNVAGFCVQETWRLGNFITTIRGHTIIHHGMEKK